jgi:hypothetical protein
MPIKRGEINGEEVVVTLSHELRENCSEIYDLAMGETANILT